MAHDFKAKFDVMISDKNNDDTVIYGTFTVYGNSHLELVDKVNAFKDDVAAKLSLSKDACKIVWKNQGKKIKQRDKE